MAEDSEGFAVVDRRVADKPIRSCLLKLKSGVSGVINAQGLRPSWGRGALMCNEA